MGVEGAGAGGRILLVDDDPALLRLLTLRLAGAGHSVTCAAAASEALRALSAAPFDAVITDLRMDGMDGMALQAEIGERWPGLPVIVITAHGTIPDAVRATQAGAVDFLTKPVSPQTLLASVASALSAGFGAPSSGVWRRDLLGDSPAMQSLLAQIRRVARGRSNVLITGPSGSGKEIVAQAVHRASDRPGAFVPVNCAAIPAALLESELFGHRKGAFTGASEASEGLLRRADGGTLLLDEIGDMPVELQAKLLRVIEDRAVRPVGASSAREVDLRIVAATHRDLDAARAAGRFRDDLYYRLRVVQLRIPPLSERCEDIPALVQHKLAALSRDQRGPAAVFSRRAIAALMQAPWPGNVRQLFNVVEQCVVFGGARVIPESVVREALEDWNPGAGGRARVDTLAEAREAFMQDYLARVLRLADGNMSEAARLARRNRTEFYKLLERHHVDRTRFRRS